MIYKWLYTLDTFSSVMSQAVQVSHCDRRNSTHLKIFSKVGIHNFANTYSPYFVSEILCPTVCHKLLFLKPSINWDS